MRTEGVEDPAPGTWLVRVWETDPEEAENVRANLPEAGDEAKRRRGLEGHPPCPSSCSRMAFGQERRLDTPRQTREWGVLVDWNAKSLDLMGMPCVHCRNGNARPSRPETGARHRQTFQESARLFQKEENGF